MRMLETTYGVFSTIYDTVPTIKDAIEAEVLTGPRVISEKDKNGK